MRGLFRKKPSLAERSLPILVVGLVGGLSVLYLMRQPQGDLPYVVASVAGHPVRIELATEPDEVARGLMFRREMGADEGMLLDFGVPGPHCLWMKNTGLELSAAFLEESGVVSSIVDLAPHDETPVCAKSHVTRVLEMPRGWFQARGVLPGQLLLEPGI